MFVEGARVPDRTPPPEFVPVMAAVASFYLKNTVEKYIKFYRYIPHNT